MERKKRLTAAVVLLGILVIGWAVISYAAEDEYKVHHNITIDLGGGTCDKIYYQSQIDNGDNAGQWNDDLRIGNILLTVMENTILLLIIRHLCPKSRCGNI